MQNLLFLKTKKALYVEDDTISRTQMSRILNMLFEQVYVACDGEEAYSLYEDKSPDILITDIKMPKCDGLTLIRRIRQNNYTLPIILMTSFDERDLVINAANLSIDGYLVKPVELDQLTSALNRAMKRMYKNVGLLRLSPDSYYNTATKELYSKGQNVVLGIKEQEILELLLDNTHRTVSKEEIAHALWPFDPICESALKNTILRLRKKLDEDLIVAVRGIGYRLDTQRAFRSDDTE